ncbi:5-formyltetrahydrofolate cyclo-ligase [Modestobacter lapidis]|nr:5-formyltetrahydrofolate cyclo-ligase [Modestobacter lapidis]
MADPPVVVTRKAELRARLLAARAARSAGDRTLAGRLVAAALAPRLARTPVVAAYVPTAEEPGAGPLPAALAAVVGRLLLPVVPDRGRELSWAEYDGRLVAGRFGLAEPPGPRLPATALGTADVVVVPALAVARDGSRLGRGAGYYDRALLLARPGTLLVGVVFDDELLDEVPAGEHDRPVSAVVTPSGGWSPVGRGTLRSPAAPGH